MTLLFNNANYANVGDATGLRGSSTAGVFWISLHTSTPDETGTQTTNESAYTNYGRISVNRASGAGGFAIASDVADNVSAITFAACGVTGSTVTHFGVGSAQTTAGNLFLYGALSASRAISNGITPEFAAGTLDVSLA